MGYELPTDLITPLGAYLHLRAHGQSSFLLESVERGRLGRSSFVGSGTRLVTFDDLGDLDAPAVGYLGYEHVARLEPTVPVPKDGPSLPTSRFVVVDTLVRFDHALGIAEVLHGDADALATRLREPPPLPRAAALEPSPTQRFPSREEYEAMVRRAKEHIRAGDIFQVVVSQRAERPTAVSPVTLYRALRRVNPSPYLVLLELGDVAIVGASPETLVKLEGRRASLNPIAGTVPRGEGDAEALLASEKDRAEHVMLVDLGRNDLSRTCVPGSVRVEQFLMPERFSHVTHLVSEVAGTLREGVGPLELLETCFPAGTVSGAPKVRAMQLIAELEGYRRGAYAGAVGYVVPGGDLDTCITIRTVVLAGGTAYLQAGAGIVADSDPAAEHEECMRKLAALEEAIDLAERSPVILVVDNYDSFTYNLVHLFAERGADIEVRRNDAVDAAEAVRLAPTHLIVSPGPGRPEDAGATIEVIRALAGRVPVLGVCLGHQAIVEAFGGVVGYAHELVHGKAAPVRHDGHGIFAGLPDPFEAGRYHSLAATTVPDVLEVSATAPDGEVMAVRHRELRVDGVQFHPESVLTPEGAKLAANFLRAG